MAVGRVGESTLLKGKQIRTRNTQSNVATTTDPLHLHPSPPT